MSGEQILSYLAHRTQDLMKSLDQDFLKSPLYVATWANCLLKSRLLLNKEKQKTLGLQPGPQGSSNSHHSSISVGESQK